jgi:hypothetical protein
MLHQRPRNSHALVGQGHRRDIHRPAARSPPARDDQTEISVNQDEDATLVL